MTSKANDSLNNPSNEPDCLHLHYELQRLFRYGRVHPLKADKKEPWLYEVKSLTNSLKQLQYWQQEKPGCGWGLRIEHRHLIVLDLENPARGNGLATIAALVAAHGPVPDGPVVTTASGGRHLWFTLPPTFDTSRIRNWTGVLPGIDIRVKGGTVVIPPTCIAGASYTWTTPLSETEEPPLIPEWLLNTLLEQWKQRKPACPPEATVLTTRVPNHLYESAKYPSKTPEEKEERKRGYTQKLRKTFSPSLQRKFFLFLIMSKSSFRAAWERRRTDFLKPGGQPDNSKYEMSIANRAVACGCTRPEVVEIFRYWYVTHGLDLKRLTSARMNHTISTAFEGTAGYRKGWEANRPKPKPKLRTAVLAFAEANGVVTPRGFLEDCDPAFRRPEAVWQMFSSLSQAGLLRRVGRGSYTAASAQLAGDVAIDCVELLAA
jgi:hypothetical protein